MTKKNQSEAWKLRFINVATTAANPEIWYYTRMCLDDAVTCFNDLGLQGYQIIIKDAVWREKVGKTMRKGKSPGSYYRIVRL